MLESHRMGATMLLLHLVQEALTPAYQVETGLAKQAIVLVEDVEMRQLKADNMVCNL